MLARTNTLAYYGICTLQTYNLQHRPLAALGTEMKWIILQKKIHPIIGAGNTNLRERLSSVDLLIKEACFVKNVHNIFIVKSS
jgi:hypothetical protein